MNYIIPVVSHVSISKVSSEVVERSGKLYNGSVWVIRHITLP